MSRHNAALGLAGLLVIGCALFGPVQVLGRFGSSRQADAPTSDAPASAIGLHAFINGPTRGYLALNLVSVDPAAGGMTVGSPDVGFVQFISPEVTIDGNSVARISYDGPAALYPDGVIDPYTGLNQLGSQSQLIGARLEATVNLANTDATAEVWIGDEHYSVAAAAPTADPSTTFDGVANVLRDRDYGALYDLLAPSWQASRTQAETVDSVSSWLGGDLGPGSLTASVTGAPVVAYSGVGYWTATGKIRLVSSNAGITLTVGLESWGDEWVLIDLRAANDPGPTPTPTP